MHAATMFDRSSSSSLPSASPLPAPLQLLVLGDRLLSLGRDGRLLVWRIGQYAAPEITIQLPRCVARCRQGRM